MVSMGYSKLAMVERFVLCLVMVLSMDVLGAAAGVFKFKPPPAMYVFGDSTLDVGNNNYLAGANVPRANRPYYGVDFPGGVPTGRFSNGYNTADFIGRSILGLLLYTNLCFHFHSSIIFYFNIYGHACVCVMCIEQNS
jgi:hypothetical protein